MLIVAEGFSMIRVRVKDALKAKWDRMLDERRISQQDAVVELIEFILEEEPLTQNMIFRQSPVADRAELSRIVLRRLGSGDKGKRAG